MTTNESIETTQQQISQLAYLNWQKDGCHQGRDLQYWLDAESQIKTARNPQAAEGQTLKIAKPEPAKFKSNGARKTSAPLKTARLFK